MTRRHVIVAIALMVGALHLVTGPGYSGPWPTFVNGYLMDIALPFALCLLLATVPLPLIASRAFRAALLLSFGALVELLQHLGYPLFGRTADPLDLVAYAAGIVGALLFERIALARLPAERTE